MSAFCRDCFADAADEAKRCAKCGSRRLLAHPELNQLSIAHLDCDAFYAAIEKRDFQFLREQALGQGLTFLGERRRLQFVAGGLDDFQLKTQARKEGAALRGDEVGLRQREGAAA